MKKIKNKGKSIKTQLMIQFGSVIAVIVAALCIFTYVFSKSALLSTVEGLLPKISENAAFVISGEVKRNMALGEVVASNPLIRDLNVPFENKKDILDANVKTQGHLNMGIADLEGNVRYNNGIEGNIPVDGSFKKALAGEIAIESPRMSSSLGKFVMTYFVPVFNENNQVVEVLVYAREAAEISSVVSHVQILGTGNATLIDGNGVIIGDQNEQNVIDKVSFIEMAKTDSDFEEMAGVIKQMIDTESGTIDYVTNGQKKLMSYYQVWDTDWKLGISVPYDEVYAGLHTMRNMSILIAIIGLLISLTVIAVISKKLAAVVIAIANRLENIASGDFDIELNEKFLNREDEIGTILKSLKRMCESISKMIFEVKTIGTRIDDKSKTLVSFSKDMVESTGNINLAMTEIADGNSKQSEELVDIASETEAFSDKVDTLNKYITIVKDNTENIGTNTNESEVIVNGLEESIRKFDVSFKDFNDGIEKLGENMSTINSITNMINEISEQTNLLALNAAIEAARAGEAGKGFAVVADEIRILAEQSKSNADEITKIIEESYNNTKDIVDKSHNISVELEAQNKNVNNVRDAVKNIVVSVEDVLPQIDNVYREVEGVKASQQLILSNIANVSAVSEEISASSEEVSASSNELNEKGKESNSLSEELGKDVENIIKELNNFKIKE